MSRLSARNISIFISHSWQYSGHYERLSEWIFSKNWQLGDIKLNFHDQYVPGDDPIHFLHDQRLLENTIYALILRSDIVLARTGMYASHSNWIEKKLVGANYYRKPILAVNPCGQKRTSTVIQSRANLTVGWNEESVLKGITDLVVQ